MTSVLRTPGRLDAHPCPLEATPEEAEIGLWRRGGKKKKPRSAVPNLLASGGTFGGPPMKLQRRHVAWQHTIPMFRWPWGFLVPIT